MTSHGEEEVHFGLTSIEFHRRTLRVHIVSASHFFEKTGQFGEVLLPVHEFTAGVPSARDYSCLQLHLLRVVRTDSRYAGVVFFSVRRGLEGAIELATLQSWELGLEQVECCGGSLPLHVGSDA